MRIGKSKEIKLAKWQKQIAKIEALAEWHPIFLWFPTLLDDEWLWWETVYRIRIHLKTEVRDGKPRLACNGYWRYTREP